MLNRRWNDRPKYKDVEEINGLWYFWDDIMYIVIGPYENAVGATEAHQRYCSAIADKKNDYIEP